MSDTLHIQIETTDEFFEQVKEDASAIDDGADVDVDVLSVPDLATLSRVLSKTNLELLQTVAEYEPDSMRETARLVERDIKNVSEDLNFLAEIGVVEIETDGRAKRPVVPYDDLEVDIPVRESGENNSSLVA
jgi:predicted transcriptional regulator